MRYPMVLLLCGIIMPVIAAIAILTSQWILFALVFSPLFLYLAIKRPFIFPFGAYLFLIPFDYILVIGDDMQGATYTKLLGVMSIAALVLSGLFEKKLRKPDTAAFWWSLFIAYSTASVFWSINTDLAYGRIETSVGLLMLYLVVASYRITDREYELVKKMIAYSGVVASTYAIVTYFFFEITFANTLRASLITGSRDADPNKFAFSLLIPIAICINEIITSTSTVNKKIMWIFTGIITLAILLTGSRGNLAGLLVIFTTFLIAMPKKRILIVAMFLPLLAMVLLLPELFINRLSESYATGGSGRLNIWSTGFEAFKHYWSFGAGLNNFPIAYDQFVDVYTFQGFTRAPHNIYLGVVVELGLLGLVIVGYAIYKHISLINISLLQRNPDRVFMKACLFGSLISSLFLDTLWTKSFWSLWMLIVMHNTIRKSEEKNHLIT
jgi:O-antigen ligase